MCLSNISGSVRVAEKDIVCYKVLRTGCYWYSSAKYFTPFRDCSVSFGTVLRKELGEQTLETIIDHSNKFGNRCGSLDASVFHCFVNYDDAKQLADTYGSSLWSLVVVKAVIPEGTEYVVGEFMTDAYSWPSIGTTAVIYKNPAEWEEE